MADFDGADFDAPAFDRGNAFDDDQAGGGYIHIRSQQRNGRKRWTTVQGIPDRMLSKRVNFDKVLKALKKSFKTNGTLVQDEELGTILQLQGDFRAEVGEFLLDQGFSDKDHLKIHGV
jgi:translation initiation factor 1